MSFFFNCAEKTSFFGIRAEILLPGHNAWRDSCAGPFLGFVKKYKFLEKYTPLVGTATGQWCLLKVSRMVKEDNSEGRIIFLSGAQDSVRGVQNYQCQCSLFSDPAPAEFPLPDLNFVQPVSSPGWVWLNSIIHEKDVYSCQSHSLSFMTTKECLRMSLYWMPQSFPSFHQIFKTGTVSSNRI